MRQSGQIWRSGIGNAVLLGVVLLVTGCGETRIPRDPVLRIAKDSVYLELDPTADYDHVEIFLGHGGKLFMPLDHRKLYQHTHGVLKLPVTFWNWRDDTTLKYHYLWHAEKPEFVYVDLITEDQVFIRRLWYCTDDRYELLYRAAAIDTTMIDSLSYPCPDSLLDLYDEAEMTWMSASTCSLPPWPEEEDTTATAKEQNFFRDSSDSQPRQIDTLPPGWGARTGRTPPGEE
jgi:hypothetical protein